MRPKHVSSNERNSLSEIQLEELTDWCHPQIKAITSPIVCMLDIAGIHPYMRWELRDRKYVPLENRARELWKTGVKKSRITNPQGAVRSRSILDTAAIGLT
jgi:hypothetical protein